MADQPASAASLESVQERKPSRLRQIVSQLRIKLTLPYALLALAVAIAAAFLVTTLLKGLLEDRFQTALLEAGQKAADMVVRVEREQLAAWRVIAYTENLALSVEQGKADDVALLATPHVLNAHLDCIDVLDRDGAPLLAMHHQPDGGVADYEMSVDGEYAAWEVVQQVLAGQVDEAGDKYAALVETEWGWVFYTAGPLKREGEIVGVLLVGTYLDQLLERLNSATLADVSIYVDSGLPLVTTLAPDEQETLGIDAWFYQTILSQQADQVPRRDVTVAEREYAVVFGAFEARHGRDLGVLAAALPLSFIDDAIPPTRQYLMGIFGVATILILLVGVWTAGAIVRRVQQLALATQQVARGDLSTQVEIRGGDEVAILASDFNSMVIQLREGRLYRDLLGMTTSPEVAQRLREGVEKGELHLQAQTTIATVLFIDIRDFTRLSEGRNPTYVLDLLNEYLQGVVGIIRAHNGVVNKFIGDAALAFFGILPEARPAADSAHDALAAASEIERYLVWFNRQRQARGEQHIRVGIGINTGPVVAGTLGSGERLEYTVLGDTVNVSQRLSDLSKEYPQYQSFIASEAYYLLDNASRAKVVHLGKLQVKGRATPVDAYAVGEG